MSRVMITTSGLVAANMCNQGFNLKVRDWKTGRYISFQDIQSTIDTTGIFTTDKINMTIVERKYKDTVAPIDTEYQAFLRADAKLHGLGIWSNYVDAKRKGRVVSENHTVYNRRYDYEWYDEQYFRCDVRQLCFQNKVYEIYT